MKPEMQVFMRGKSDYSAGKSIEDNPFRFDSDLSSHWIEGYQMAAYEEKKRYVSAHNH